MDAPVSRSTAVESLRNCVRSSSKNEGTDDVPLAEIAGRTVAEPVVAPEDTPARDVATMDGFAVATDDGYPLTVAGRVTPDADPPSLAAGETVRVATGALLPDRADAVLPAEEATVSDGRLRGPSLSFGANLYPAGATAEAGEVLFEPGERLAPRHAAFLRDVGIERVPVRSRLSVGILATGTEICRGVQPDRDSEMLANLVRQWGHAPTVREPVADDETRIREEIAAASDEHDVVLTSGGTSVGREDYVGRVLSEHDLLFTGIDLRPGRPTTAAVVDDTLVCGLPGKPLAAHTAAVLVLAPAFDEERPAVSVQMSARVELPSRDVEYAIPVRLADGRADPVGRGTSERALYETRFAPGRVASSTRTTRADGAVLTDEPLSADQQVTARLY